MIRRVMVIAVATLLLAVPTAQAAFPGTNGKIVDDALVTGNESSSHYVHAIAPDGSNGVALTEIGDNFYPRSSPDGQKIVWACQTAGLCTMNFDGSGKTQIFTPAQLQFTPVPSWSPDGSKIIFSWQPSEASPSQIYTINPDGSGMTGIGVEGEWPAYSPDGQTIAFRRAGMIHLMDADGTNQAPMTTGTYPNWSPDGARLTFERAGDVYAIDRDGTGETRLTTHPDVDTNPAWSPDGSKIAFGSNRDRVQLDPGFDNRFLFEIYVMNPDGTGQTRITRNDLVDPLDLRSWFAPTDWQPIPINSYPRPKGATPTRLSLTLAYSPCASPNRNHGPPLAFPSCNPPVPNSPHLTIASPDVNGAGVQFTGFLRTSVLAGDPATPADEADVALDVSTVDVRCSPTDTPATCGAINYGFPRNHDYTGELEAVVFLRITDKDNTPHPGGPGAATVEDFDLRFAVPCVETASDDMRGSSCAIATSVDALIPGAVQEGRRAAWELDRVHVRDGGPDGVAATPDNRVFVRPGVFIP